MKQAVGYSLCRSDRRAGRWPARLTTLLLCAASLWTGALAAAEIYTWTDANGVVHYSQTPPPQGQGEAIEAPEAYKPGSVSVEPPAAETGAGEPTLTAAQARRQQMDEQREANRERRAQNEQLCNLYRQRLEQLEPARRVFYTDETGQQVRMDDDQRIALIEEARTFVDENCAG